MTELVLVGAITAAGAALTAPTWSRLRWGLAWLALPVGAGAWALASLALLGVGVEFSPALSLGITGTAGLAVVLTTARRGDGSLAAWPCFAVAVGGTVALGAVFLELHLTRLTVDSVRYLLPADVLSATGRLNLASVWDVRMRQLVTPLLHVPGVVDGPGYSAVITPLLAVSGVSGAGWIAWRAFERHAVAHRTRWALLGTLGLLLLTTNRFAYHAFYVNGHMFFAVFLVLGIGLGILAITEQDSRWILPASIAFAAIVALRPEGLITVAIFLVPLLVSDRIPYRARWRLLIPTVATSTLWHGVVWPLYASSSDLGLTGPVYGMLFLAWALTAGLGFLAIPSVRRYAAWGPIAVAAALAAYVTVQAVGDPDLLRDSLAAAAANLAVEGLWGAFWLVVPFLMTGAWLVVSRSSPARLLTVAVATYGLVALPAFSYLRGGPFRVGTGDSGSRMLVHVTLAVCLAILLAAAEAIGESDEPAS